MSSISIGCELTYTVGVPTDFVFNILAAHTPRQRVADETLDVSVADVAPDWCEPGEPGYRSLRLSVDAGDLTVNYRAQVALSPAAEQAPELAEMEHKALPADVLVYLNPSRYCEVDRVSQLAAQEFGHLAPGYSRVNAICDWVSASLAYVPGASNASTSACDVLLERAGVCRDFAHVAIALCRGLGIPARYVAGYAAGLQPPDFHGFLEAYLDHDWYLFDPTRMAPIDGLVRIAVGRDAADTPFASIVGQAQLQRMVVSAEATSADGLGGSDLALSTA